MRLIDAHALIDEINDMWQNHKVYLNNEPVVHFGAVIDLIGAASVIEAKPVVHCRDCKYNVANRQQDPLDITDYTDIVCDYFMTDGMKADDFCSKGVKIPVISIEDVPKVAKEMEK